MRKYTWAIVFLAVLACCAGSVAQAPPAPAPEALAAPTIISDAAPQVLDQEGPGKLIQLGEHLLCVMEGTPEEMGFQHGRLLAKKIRHIIKEGYMPKALYERGYTPEYVNAQSKRMETHIPPEYIAEMQGVVKGLQAAGITDVTYEEILLGVTQAEICHHGPNAPPACSNFAVFGQWTTDARLLHGRNLDWSIGRNAQEDAVFFIWRPKDGSPFAMPGWAGGIGSVSGLNARGITIGEMTSSSTDETFDGMPLMIIMRRVCEKAANLDEAVAIMQQGPRTIGWNFIIGDAARNDARALEVDAKNCEVFAPMDPKETSETGHWALPDAVRRTNHPCGVIMIEKLIARYGAQYGIDPKDWKPALPLLFAENTWQRYDWLGKQFQANAGKMDVKEAIQCLMNGPVKNSDTLHSWVFDPKNQAVFLAVAGFNPPVTATDRPFTKIDLSPWFKQ